MRDRRALTTLLGTTTAVLALLAPGVRADPAGTRLLNADRTEAPFIQVLGASSSGVLYTSLHSDLRRNHLPGTTWFVPTGGSPVSVPGYDALVGNRLFNESPDQSTVTYRTTSSATTHTCPAGAAPVFNSLGWVSMDSFISNPLYTLTRAGTTGCTTQTIGRIDSDYARASDASGFLVSYWNATQTPFLKHVSYASPPVITDVSLAGSKSTRLDLVALEGNHVAWFVGATSSAGTQPSPAGWVYRTTLGGGAAVETPVDNVVERLAVTPAQTAWSTTRGWDPDELVDAAGSIPVAGGAQTIRHDVTSVVADAGNLYFDGQSPTPGIYRASSFASSRTLVLKVPSYPPLTSEISVAAARVAYVDTQGAPSTTGHVRSWFSSSLGTVANLPGVTGLAVDGRRAVFVRGGRLVLRPEGAADKVLFTASADAIVSPRRAQLSGSRVLWFRGDFSEVPCELCNPRYDNVQAVLTDLRTGTSTDLGPAIKDRWALWGSYLVHGAENGSISRRDLSSGQVVSVKSAGAPLSSVAVHSRWVGWSTCVLAHGDPCGSSTTGFRDVTGAGPVLTKTTVDTTDVRLSDGYLAYATGSNPRAFRVWRLGTTSTKSVATLPAYSPAAAQDLTFDTYDEELAWVGTDHVARLAPTAAYVAPPYFLGNALGDFSVARGSQLWQPEFPLSKPLARCSVVIQSTITLAVLKRLACPAATSSARVAWDGRLDDGRLVPRGTYRWGIVGSDADGALRWWTGSTHPVAGTMTIV